MRRRDFISIALAAVLPTVPALPQTRTRRIGWLGTTPPSTPEQQAIVDAFNQVLREHGFVEGQTILIERRHSYGQEDRHSGFAAELVGMNVDLIVAVSAGAAAAASRATSAIPIVTVDGSDPQRQGLVASLARPGGNVTGLSNSVSESASKFLQIAKEALPSLSRVAIFWNPDNPGSAYLFGEINRPSAVALGLTVIPIEVRGPADLEQAFETQSDAQPHKPLRKSADAFEGSGMQRQSPEAFDGSGTQWPVQATCSVLAPAQCSSAHHTG